ncbi:MAG: TolC family protein [Desulfobulbaceae bacterium]
MKTRPVTGVQMLLASLPLLLLAGCMQPENLRTFEPAWHEVVPSSVEPVPIPEELQPQFGDDGPMATAVDLRELTVEQAIWLTLANNQDLRVRRLTPVIAGTFEAIERGVYDPEFFAEAAYRTEENEDSDTNGTAAGSRESERILAVGVRQQLPSGTLVEGVVEQQDNETGDNPREESARLGISVTQALLRGAGPTVNLVSIRQAELNSRSSRHELRGVIEAVLAEAENAYWEFVLAGLEIDIFVQSLVIARQQLGEIEQRIEVGTLPRIEAAAAKAEVAHREQQLIAARSTLEERRLRLVRLLNPAGNGNLDLAINAISDASIEPVPITDLDDRLQLAEKMRPDLAQAHLLLRQNQLQTIVTANGLLPRLDLFITLGKTGYADSFSAAFRNLDGDAHDVSAGIRLSQYLDNRQARAKNFAARASRQQAEEAVENLRQIVGLDVRLAVNEVERARQLIGATRVTRLLQEETMKAEKERFDVGASTALLVAQAQRDLLASAIVEVESVVSYRKALVNLYLAEGSLLERRGVGFSEP